MTTNTTAASSGGGALDRVLDRLQNVQQVNGGFRASCPMPGHGKGRGDLKPSLSVGQGDDGRVLLKCHLDCDKEEILGAIGLSMGDLFEKPASNGHKTNGRRSFKPPGPIVKTYDYPDENGELLYQTTRHDPKDFRQRRPNGRGGWIWNLHGVRRVLYRLPELLAADPAEPIFYFEGEKDANRGAAEGFVSTTNARGAKEFRPEYAETLRGRSVVMVQDNDEDGRKGAQKKARTLYGEAASVKVLELPGVPENGGDFSDWLDAGGTAEELEELAAQAPEWAPPEPDDSGSVYSPHIEGGFGENKKPPKNPLPIKTVDEILEEAGKDVPWIIENVLARGALTDFSGLAKKGGKTTFWCHAIAAGARGEDHAGFVTEPAKYLYLSEQGGNFAGALRESGLAEYPEHVSIVQYKDVSVVGWDTLINQAGAEAKRRGMDALIVDTFAVFARLKGSEENDAGPVADRMRVLRLVAQKYDIGVVLIRHSGKDGSPRGSSAFEAEADICVNLSRPEGRHAPSVRKITGIGRYGEWERNVQLTDGRFISLGADDKIEFNKAVKLIKAVLPISPEDGMRKQHILDTRTENDDVSASTVDRALAWLVKQGDVGEKQLMNQRGKPKVYWLAHKPPGGGDDGGFIYSHQTPFIKEENKSGNDGPARNGLVPDAVVAEFARHGSGSRINLPLYLREDTTLEILTRSVLVGLGRDPDDWQHYAPLVDGAARDVRNHPEGCPCPLCCDVEVF